MRKSSWKLKKGIKGDSSVHNLLLTAPTGAGKSLLFQLPAIYLGNEYKLLTLVVSPLKALIVDQVEALQELGYERVAYASSDLSPEQKNEVYRRVRDGEVDLFYLSPELLLAYDISYFVGERRIGLVVVDEAHTVTTWVKSSGGLLVSRASSGSFKECVGICIPCFCIDSHCCVESQRWERYDF